MGTGLKISKSKMYVINEHGKRILNDARKAQMREYNRIHMKEILEYQSKYKSERIKNDPLHRLERNIKQNIRYAFKNNGWKLGSKLHMIVGLPFEDYKAWIENQWEEGMSWENYGIRKDQWVTDHLICCSSAKDELEMISLFHFKNTAPMWSVDNVRKGKK